MPRPLREALEHKGNSWVASVPRIRGSRQRMSCSYSLERKAEAKQWIAKQIDRLNAGLEAEQAPRQDRAEDKTPTCAMPAPSDWARVDSGRGHVDGSVGPDFSRVAQSLVMERYEMLRAAQAERADDVRRMIRLHLEPVFRGPIPLDSFAGRTRIVHWVVARAGRTGEGSPFTPAAKPVKRSTMEERLRVLCMILDHAHRLDRRVENFARDVPAQDPLGHQETPTRLLGLPEAAKLAGELHVVHQFVLWMLRILGPRISEPYGLLVEDFIDAGGEAALLVRAQGGRTFKLWGDQPGEVITTGRKEGGHHHGSQGGRQDRRSVPSRRGSPSARGPVPAHHRRVPHRPDHRRGRPWRPARPGPAGRRRLPARLPQRPHPRRSHLRRHRG